jgi:hypothetical protein
MWSHVTLEMEADLDLDNIVPGGQDGGVVVQVDGGITPESITPEDVSTDTSREEICQDVAILELAEGSTGGQLSPREVRQLRRWKAQEVQGQDEGHDLQTEGEFLDDGYTDQESVFGENESDFVYRRLFDKFVNGHTNYQTRPETEEGARFYRLSQTLDFDIPVHSGVAVEVEKFEDFPSAASFPTEEVDVPGYNYHMSRRRVLSFSSPDLCDDRRSQSAWSHWYWRLWRWGREFRRIK